jgi:hypothetical protein
MKTLHMVCLELMLLALALSSVRMNDYRTRQAQEIPLLEADDDDDNLLELPLGSMTT